MAFLQVSAVLPKCVTDRLVESGAIVRRGCEIPIYELEGESASVFMDFLGDGCEEIDPILTVDFGPPLAPFVSPHVQVEVLGLLNTFLPLMDGAFAVGAPPIVYLPIMAAPMGGFQYHHPKIAIQRVQQEMENPTIAGIVHLRTVPSAQTICNLTIGYANCFVARRIRKL